MYRSKEVTDEKRQPVKDLIIADKIDLVAALQKIPAETLYRKLAVWK